MSQREQEISPKGRATRPGSFDPIEWSRPLSTVFGLLLIFSQFYYSHLKPSWGGGSPVPVTMFFTKESVISPSRFQSLQLIEEAEEGFYIVGPGESKAMFIPRSTVSLIFFPSKSSDSETLRNGK